MAAPVRRARWRSSPSDRRAPDSAAARGRAGARPGSRGGAAAGDPGPGLARGAAGDTRADGGPGGQRRRPRAGGSRAADHLGQPRHAAPDPLRGLPVAARPDGADAADRQHAATGTGGRQRHRGRARSDDDRARARRRRPAEPRRAARPPRRGGRPDRRTGADPRRHAGQPARRHGPRADDRQAARPGPGARLDRRAGAGRPRARARHPPRLLGPFEPLLLGWVSREPILGDNTSVATVNGIFKPIALVGGRAVATWTMPKGKVELAPFGRLRAADRKALETDAADVARFLAS